MKSLIRSFIPLAALGLAGAMAGGTSVAAEPPAHVEEPPAAPERVTHGFVQILEEALDEVTLRADQEASVERLVNQLEPLQAQVDEAESGLLLALADQMAAGRIDRNALEPHVVAYATARTGVSIDVRGAIQALHALLDPAQRADFSDALESRLHEVRRAILAGERLDDLAGALHLRDEQVTQIRDALENVRPALEHERMVLHHTVEAFRGDVFSIEQILPQNLVAERARQRANLIIDLTASTLEVLDAAQRGQLAARIREAAQARVEDVTGTIEMAPSTPPKAAEHTGAAAEAWVAAGVRRGPRGRVRGGVIVASPSARFAFRRVRAFPVAAGWGFGW